MNSRHADAPAANVTGIIPSSLYEGPHVFSFLLPSTICLPMRASVAVHILFTAALASATSLVRKDIEVKGCGTQLHPDTMHTAMEDFKQRRVVRPDALTRRQNGSTTPLELYFHVISADETVEGGNYPDPLIEAQHAILNAAFVPTGYSFDLVRTTRTVNATWYYNATQLSTNERDMKTALRQGGVAALNVYAVGLTDDSIQAWSTLPLELGFNIVNDGVVIHQTVLLGGNNPMFNEGKTLIHEAGHWVGLSHTFAGGCSGNYDYVDDTPLEDWPTELGGCPIGRDSCPDDPGLDPIHNYMDYTEDSCRFEFTPGQVVYLTEQMETYRKVSPP